MCLMLKNITNALLRRSAVHTSLPSLSVNVTYPKRSDLDSLTNYALAADKNRAKEAGMGDPDDGSPQGTRLAKLLTLYADPRVKAFLYMIRYAEHGRPPRNEDYYSVITNRRLPEYVTDLTVHPFASRAPAVLNIQGRKVQTTAAGAYQFLLSTWQDLVVRVGIFGKAKVQFTPLFQDLAAVHYLESLGAISALLNDDFITALKRASKSWASLPYSTAGQNPKTLAQVTAFYEEAQQLPPG